MRRPVEALRRELERSRRSHPAALQLVYVLSDGEPRGRDSGEKGYSEVHDLIDGGAVLGYGTSQGGRMKENLGGDPAKSGYIVDPKTKSEAISRIDEGQLRRRESTTCIGRRPTRASRLRTWTRSSSAAPKAVRGAIR